MSVGVTTDQKNKQALLKNLFIDKIRNNDY
jgi:hypothetical protein